MKYIYKILLIYLLTLYTVFGDQADITNVVKIDANEIIEIVSKNFNISKENISILLYSEDNNSIEIPQAEHLIFLMGEKDTSSKENLSDSFKVNMPNYEKNSIPKILFSNKYSVINKIDKSEIIRISLNSVDGWGYDSGSKMAYESYMLLGYIHDTSIKSMNSLSKRKKENYVNSYSKIYFTKPGMAPFTKADEGLWCYSFAARSNFTEIDNKENRIEYGVAYFEIYAKSLQVIVFKTYDDTNSNFTQSFTLNLSKNINSTAKKIGIYPDPKSIKSLYLSRKKHFETSEINNYILEIEKIRKNDKVCSENHNELSSKSVKFVSSHKEHKIIEGIAIISIIIIMIILFIKLRNKKFEAH